MSTSTNNSAGIVPLAPVAMSDAEDLSADTLRSKGNDLYRTGRLSEAIPYYQRAAEVGCTDSRPYSNLAAAQFELGDYKASLVSSASALALLPTAHPGNEVKRQKQMLRRAKCHLHLKNHEAALESIALLSPCAETVDLEGVARSYQHAQKQTGDGIAAWEKICLDVPRYKPTLLNEAEYFPIGHEEPTSLYDASMLSEERESLSFFFFGGIGDARHLYQTLVELGEETRSSKSRIKEVHCTIVDIKASSIARNVVIMLLLDEATSLVDDRELLKMSALLPCLFYTYLCELIPTHLYGMLQQRIKRAIKILRGRAAFPS
ncbi:hypothetical protein CLAFUW4_10042 [Fulvia fulva]|uniref:DUF4470 domain-containing protein n=1 Tax=Passalora fulva TaxID=5499 RepID=A0A9Q8PHJ3_PASFU|nr:uncharacterized protein CLAFUR5_12202 [Fulvia fulva]KAK4616114.1 hypothetical protein CLAFUR4_10046 [Fulvia fulva]KAK4616979.1 hypothetical protein CLAFUR0_10044 [Fulvia fulva]UJO22563.1 hypothetical protein CLAFUR5_12202 [Fulvia fulva]WPV19224.1 hypothetical protein CLAFUW4_10042 [Fulvia fulva]WPV34672.1 hypothetical protein CLAFUW7_10043 [Fulvia fulva]